MKISARNSNTSVLQHKGIVKWTGDLRQVDFDASQVWETYPRYGALRWFPPPPWAEQLSGEIPTQSWLEERRPRSLNV